MDGVLRQQTPQMPIGWFGLTADTLPYTIIGAIDWADITVTADILLPKSTTGKSTSIGWIGARVSQTAEECDGEAQVEHEFASYGLFVITVYFADLFAGPGVICSNPWGLCECSAAAASRDWRHVCQSRLCMRRRCFG